MRLYLREHPRKKDRKRTIGNTTPVFDEIGICGGTSSLAAVRAKQMARQRDINSTAARKLRNEEYLKNLNDDEEREKLEKKERARANASVLEDQKFDHLTARAERLRLRSDFDTLPSYAERRLEGSSNSETPYSVLKARRKEVQSRRQSNDRREQISKDLERARALLDQERQRDHLEIVKDLTKRYRSAPRRSNFGQDPVDRRREPTSSILKADTRRRVDLEDEWRPSTRSRFNDERSSEMPFGRSSAIQRDFGESSVRGNSTRTGNDSSRRPKEVHWSMDDY